MTIETLADEDFLTASATDAHGGPVSVWVVDASQRQDDPDGTDMYGTFCGHTTEPIRFDPGTTLELWIGGEWWPRWWIIPEPGKCSPAVATTGTVRVTLSGWTSSEAASSSPEPGGSTAPQPSPTAQPEAVERSVDLAVRQHLRSDGAVTSDDASCRSNVPVVIEKKRSGVWVEVGSTTTADNGAFSPRLTDRPGRYRAVAPEFGSSERTCLVATSPTARHRH